MTTHTTGAALLSAIAADPTDTQLWLVLADWLEENGDPTAAGWRWLAQWDASRVHPMSISVLLDAAQAATAALAAGEIS